MSCSYISFADISNGARPPVLILLLGTGTPRSAAVICTTTSVPPGTYALSRILSEVLRGTVRHPAHVLTESQIRAALLGNLADIGQQLNRLQNVPKLQIDLVELILRINHKRSQATSLSRSASIIPANMLVTVSPSGRINGLAANNSWSSVPLPCSCSFFNSQTRICRVVPARQMQRLIVQGWGASPSKRYSYLECTRKHTSDTAEKPGCVFA